MNNRLPTILRFGNARLTALSFKSNPGANDAGEFFLEVDWFY
jgi:hypothetical protein